MFYERQASKRGCQLPLSQQPLDLRKEVFLRASHSLRALQKQPAKFEPALVQL